MGFAEKVRRIANSIVARERDGRVEFLCSFENSECWSWSRDRAHAINLTEAKAREYASIVGGEARFAW